MAKIDENPSRNHKTRYPRAKWEVVGIYDSFDIKRDEILPKNCILVKIDRYGTYFAYRKRKKAKK